MRLKDVLVHLDRVLTEERVARVALEQLQESLLTDASLGRLLPFDRIDIRECRRNIEHTYVVRVFAVFEWILREMWANVFHRRTNPRMVDLINGVAAARKFVNQQLVQNVHAVREYRNTLVHVGAPSAPPVTLAECGRYLKAFLSELPREW